MDKFKRNIREILEQNESFLAMALMSSLFIASMFIYTQLF